MIHGLNVGELLYESEDLLGCNHTPLVVTGYSGKLTIECRICYYSYNLPVCWFCPDSDIYFTL